MDGVFAASAFRHGYTKQDFYEVLAGRYLKIRSQRGLDDVYELLGRNLGGDYLHVIYRVLADGRLRVFHIGRMSGSQRRRYQRYRR
ncbi:MAG: hypothetical protein ACREQK_13215 [Candidatus Binatia bacterium]